MSLVKVYSKYFTYERVVNNSEVYALIQSLRQDYDVDSWDIIPVEVDHV